MNLTVLYVAVPQAENMGCKDMLFCEFKEDHQILLLWNWSHEVLGVFCFRDQIIIPVVLQNFN